MSVIFFASLGVAIWLVYIFCQRKFAERSVTESADYLYQLLPRQLATREEYSKGFLIYFGSMVLMVVLLSLLGASNLETIGVALPKQLSYVGVPLAIAFVLMGALPNVPGLMLVESFLRQYAHERAYIPVAARATAERLAAADFEFTSYQGEALQSPEMRGVEAADFSRSRHTLECAWARLCCLIFALKSYRMDGLTDSLDAGLLLDYKSDLDLIESQKSSMEAQVAAYRIARASDPHYVNETLRRDIADRLYKLYVLLGCAVRVRIRPHDDIDLALRPLGFRLNRARRPQSTGDLKLVGLAAAAVSIILAGLAAYGLGQLNLWIPSDMFPQDVLQPFVDAASTLVPHATAIMIADLMRRRAVDNGSWFRAGGSLRRVNDANYVRVAVVCGIAGYVGLILWGLTEAPPTRDGFKIVIPYALLAMVTGGFYIYHLDNAEISRRPSRAWELGAQSALTGLCGLIAACANWQIILPTAVTAVDRILLTTVINATVGCALAWYIPQAAAAARYDPLAEASKERVRALETTAQLRLADAAPIWLDREHPALGGTSPRAAAADGVDGFERAIGLLHGPKGVAA
jgi:hypothetical protein